MPLFQTWGYIMQPTDEDLEDLILLFNDPLPATVWVNLRWKVPESWQFLGERCETVKQWNQPCFLGNSFNKDTLAIVPLIRLKPVLAWSTIILELF